MADYMGMTEEYPHKHGGPVAKECNNKNMSVHAKVLGLLIGIRRVENAEIVMTVIAILSR